MAENNGDVKPDDFHATGEETVVAAADSVKKKTDITTKDFHATGGETVKPDDFHATSEPSN
ncbi:hypothetical protein SALBM311S_12990 [Streptomyces alboniger]